MDENKKNSEYSMVNKWGKKVSERGFTQIPIYLLNINRFLTGEFRLKPTELMVLFHLVSTWWKADENPFPSMATLAVRCGVSSRQVQRSINKLDSLGFISRKNRKQQKMILSNSYSMKPLVLILSAIAEEYPTEYPRKVTKEDKEKISSKIEDILNGVEYSEM
ncbi:helix-turn-helix domain-containing protein [Gluconobacter kondonii]|uniref:helix-turn-helix domain-containing protein n=1 Tax=Gluconobacter kondonii TaxID=941463 RepID=UPI001B8C142A|nr:helix-turn-helix domain-containing protein [Gluconobacter kondonii]MBS1066905.1 helix-turn-helix domain-containing protein [Gluconobacter kondonii]